ncbi:MAG: SAM-dependent methyltransferase [Bacteroidales bacterium]|nr:SAM-dependent methyltransferase [Bacteroidales bacterium]
MASLQKIYSNEKLNGKIYTPDFIINKILNDIKFNEVASLGKTILDPACGDGRFLCETAKRIIRFSSEENLKENLEKIEGWDIDEVALKDARNNLNELIKDFHFKIDWKLVKKDTLKEKKTELFDFIVGNPPYIRIQHLEKKQRLYIQEHYNFCKKGSTDIYIAFFESAYKLLKNNGICGFITPNTYFNTETGKELRNFFELKKNLIQITNYGAIQLFENATTYSAITIFSKQKYESFLYEKAKNKNSFLHRKINYSELNNRNFWQLSVNKTNQIKGKRLGDICNIHVGITTLADKAYIFEIVKEKGETVTVKTELKGDCEIEKAILKPIIKASLLGNLKDKQRRIILFPYKKINGKNKIIDEVELKTNYPSAYKYLLSVKDVLDKRDNGKPNKVAWYAFGRTQSLNSSFGKKILFSPMNKKPNFILINDTKSTFYSGYCIKYFGDYKKLLKQLNSKQMEEFIEISSRDFRGGWKAYNKKILQEFIIDIQKL